jgi:16S rRNA processing protein RimM
MTEWLNVGKIVNTHGLHGEVRVISRTDFPDKRYASGSSLFLALEDYDYKELTVKSHRKHKQFDLVAFEGYSSINDVEKFKGGLLKVRIEQLSELNEGEFYYHEIIGCSIFSEEGEEIGNITDVLSPGANDVWVVQRKGNRSELLIPYIEDIVKDVDIENKRVTIHVMDGLIDED